jgi:hypothetical protein
MHIYATPRAVRVLSEGRPGLCVTFLHSTSCTRAVPTLEKSETSSHCVPHLLIPPPASSAAHSRCCGARPGGVVQAEDKEALLRKEARDARLKAAELSDKARGLRALAQKGVNNVLEAALPPAAPAP